MLSPPLDAGLRPGERVARACAAYSIGRVTTWCADLLADRSLPADSLQIEWLGNGDWPPYWRRVWGCRAFLYVWDDAADQIAAIAAAAEDDAPAVRRAAERALETIARASS